MTGWMKRLIKIYVQLMDMYRNQLAKTQESVILINTVVKSILKTLTEEKQILNKMLSVKT